ncbi:hypothetical protein FPQ18DRAFT_378220 [Pyronema domesticum]|nr:hypothetical protein FPQ18DRAFT_378220 [Pyronema domesticum]
MSGGISCRAGYVEYNYSRVSAEARVSREMAIRCTRRQQYNHNFRGFLRKASFQQLFHFFDNSTEDVPDILADDFDRLKVWAENVGAHRRGTLGLDHRLREASSVKESAKSLLKDLNDVLEETSRDHLERMEKIDVSSFEPFDIAHVSNKYPLNTEQQYIIERLGKANSKRRQILKCHQDRHEKVVGLRVPTAGAVSADGSQGVEGIDIDEHDYLSEAPSAMHTIVSTV